MPEAMGPVGAWVFGDAMAAGLEQAAASQGKECGAADGQASAEISGRQPEVVVHGAAELAEATRDGCYDRIPSKLPIPEAEPVEPAIDQQRIPAVADFEFIGNEQQLLKGAGAETTAAAGLDRQVDGAAEQLQLLQPGPLLVEGQEHLRRRRRGEALQPGAMAQPGVEHPREGGHGRERGDP